MSTALDRDTAAVTDSLDEALATSGLSLRQFATALGASPSRLCSYRTGKSAPSAAFMFRARRIAQALAAARGARLPTSLDAARAITKADARGNDDRTLAIALEIRDRLRATLAEAQACAEAWEAAPALPNPRWATLLSALVAHEFTESGRRPPTWTNGRCLAHPWIVDSLHFSPDEVRAQTPEWLAERNVFISPHDLMTV